MSSSLLQQQNEQKEVSLEEAIKLARGHHEAGNYVIAERTYHDILRAEPENAVANQLLGALYYKMTNLEQAIHYMDISTKLSPNEPQYWSNYGGVLGMMEEYDRALECLDKAIKLMPKHLDAINNKALILWRMEHFDEAAKVAKQSLEIVEDNIEGLSNLALALSKLKKFKEADKIWEKASQLYPNDANIWCNWANMCAEAQQPKRALPLAQRAVELSSDNPEAHYNLGCALNALGQGEEAVAAFREATNILPKYYQAHHNMSISLLELSRYDDAAISARYAIAFKDDYAPSYNVLSVALREMGEFPQAHFAAQRAVSLDPQNPEYYCDLADILMLISSLDDGQAALKTALDLAPDDAATYEKLANVFERMTEVDDALEAIDRAVELSPETPRFLLRKASILQASSRTAESLECSEKVLEMAPDYLPAIICHAESLASINQMDEAEKFARRAQKINKNYAAAYFTISSLKTFKSEDDEDLQIMLELEKDIHKSGKAESSFLHYALSNAYEDLEDYDKAFHFLEIANQEKRKTISYDSTSAPDAYEWCKSTYSANFFEAMKGKGCEDETPIFIVGMPRSGTTLTEQIISSHPDVFGAGELPDLGRAHKRIGDITTDNAAEAGQLYIDLIRAREPKGEKSSKFIINKMPGNYLSIGLIAATLPNAKIIHCGRNPIDTCLSCYKQNFLVGQSWSCDQEELAAEYLRYLDLMDYWDSVLPNKILHIDYNDTVNDLENQARKLIDFIGLEWNDACLEPHKQKRTVITASKVQITKPVYQSSVQKWKKYEKHLQPLVRILLPEEALPIEETPNLEEKS